MPSTSLRHRQLRRTAFTASGIAALLILTAAVAWWSGEMERRHTLDYQRSRSNASLQLRADSVAGDLEQLRRDARLLAAVARAGADAPGGHARLEAVLAAYRATNGELQQVRLLGLDGRTLAQATRDRAALPAASGQMTGLAPGQVRLAELASSQLSRHDMGAVTLVMDGAGRPAGILELRLDMRPLLQRARTSLSPDFDLSLRDSTGHYLLQPARRAAGTVAHAGSSPIALNPGDLHTDLQMTIALPASALAANVAAARRDAMLTMLGGLLIAGAGVLLYRRLHRRAERERNERAALVASSHDAIIGKTLDGIVTSWNGGAERLFGYSAEEACGRSLASLVVPRDQLGQEAAILARIRQGDVVASFDTVRQRKDGCMVDVAVTVAPIRAANGKVIGAAKTVRDISAAKASAAHILELNKSLERQVAERTAQISDMAALHQAVLDNAAYAIVASDTTGKISVFNPAAERLVGYTAAEVIGRSGPDLFHDAGEIAARAAELSDALGTPVPADFNVFVAEALRGLHNEHEWTYVRKDGQRIPALVSVTALKRADGALIGFLGIAADLSERKAAQRALEARTREAEAANRAKSAFLANMSHEIRTPMNAILGMLQLLRKGGLPPREADYTNKADGAARALLGILNDILDFSRVEAGKMTLEQHPFSVDQLLGETATIMAANIGAKDLELVFDIDPALPRSVVGDPLRLQQILINLAGNAIKFTRRGDVVLACRVGASGAGQVRLDFSVRDTGIGIAPDQCHTIFEGFSQAEASTARRYGGSGLGLAICQRLVALMGGQLAVDSHPGQGSTFHFDVTLPVVDARPQFAPLHGLRCLVVDDNAHTRHALLEQLAAFGWQADWAASAAQAMTSLAGPAYDVVLLDWELAGNDAGALGRVVRRSGPVAPMLLALSARYGGAHDEAAPDSRPDAVLVKPVNAGALCAALGSQRRAPSPAPAAGGRLQDLRLLLVDDNVINQQVACALLRDQGAHVVVAGGGYAALDELGKGVPFDAVLMDVQMPDLDGYAATMLIRERPDLAALPVIAVTANAMPSDRAAALAAGMNDHVTKPFDIGQLVDVILRHTPAPPRASPALPVFDPDAALRRFGGKLDIYQAAVQNWPDALDTVAAGLDLDVHGRAGVRASLHTLKGLAATIGAEQLAALARQADTLLQSDAPAQAASGALAAVHAAVAPARAAAQQWLRAAGPAQETAPCAPSDTLAAALGRLRPLLAHHDMAALAQCDALHAQFSGAAPVLLATLRRTVHQLTFPAALQQCTAMLEQRIEMH